MLDKTYINIKRVCFARNFISCRYAYRQSGRYAAPRGCHLRHGGLHRRRGYPRDLRLLNHLGLKKPMVSYYEHALHHGEAILQRIEAGENCALCSDAGMPCISDPGEQIVREAHERGIVVPIPAASACVTALAASGQPTARFVFEGFCLCQRRPPRAPCLLQNETRTMIFYEAPHKLRGTLDDLAAAFGAGRSVSLCRELTKLHEEIKNDPLVRPWLTIKKTTPRRVCAGPGRCRPRRWSRPLRRL